MFILLREFFLTIEQKGYNFPFQKRVLLLIETKIILKLICFKFRFLNCVAFNSDLNTGLLLISIKKLKS